MNKCNICDSTNLKISDFEHILLRECKEIFCDDCKHFFYDSQMDDTEFTNIYISKSKTLFINKDQLNIFQKSFWLNLSRFQLIKNFINSKNESINVLEIGPGFPGLSYFWYNYDLNNNLYISEPDVTKKELFKKHLPDTSFFDFDNEYLNPESPFSKYFDVIILNNVFYYFKDPLNILSKLKNFTKKDGIIFVDILNPFYIDKEYKKKIDMRHVFNKESLQIAFDKLSFKKLFLDFFDDNQEKILKSFNKKINFIDKLLYKFFKLVRVNSVIKLIINDTSSNFSNPRGMYLRGVFKND